MATTSPPRLLTRTEAAEYLGLAKSTLEVWACTKRYDLPFIKVGRAVRYRVADLELFIERNTIGGNDND